MGRWEADARGRLQQAAMSLYLERGFDDVTVAEIAETAGLTKRTFFRHFADKREVFFSGAQLFEAGVLASVEQAAEDASPMDAVIGAFAAAGAQLAEYADFQRQRRALIASSTDLQERELVKMADLAGRVVEVLLRRGAGSDQARLAAHTGVAVFTVAYDRWVDEGATADLPALVRRTLEELRLAITPA
ncbi:TetR/AcrR family transcriptional regulator [Modestobacter sp. L9-4]|uniref:TetR family transcriptional regulator n=1 Tax=Modestobacter sp. L9-4 TaxID=2851567 RepID=UPI001C748E97|nr:TetR family transcriptional regulator [Modestobacter sp. L9-4]QXG77699.1 TetR/AcrR family transcriptional regulator [Modestobacter sp. L9-4]